MKRTRIVSLLLTLVLCLSLLPMAAMAEEDAESYTITFDAAPGKFEDGSSAQSIPTRPEGVIMYAPDTPTREGYTFVDWDGMDYDELKYHVFTADTTVKATWEKKPEMLITLDPNGGQFEDGSTTVKNVPLNSITSGGPFPTVSKSGFTLDGWYMNYESPSNPGVKMENWSFTGPNSLTAVWKKDGEAEQEPEQHYAGEIWFHLEGGTVVSVGGVTPDSNGDAALPGGDYFSQRPDEGDEVLGVMMPHSNNGKLSALPVLEKEGYTFDGWYTMKTGGNKVTTDTVFTGSGKYGRDYLWARWTENKASETPSNPDGPFTVTFHLNGGTGTTPKAQTVKKGGTVDLPDPKNLTAPRSNYAFGAWGYLANDGNLYVWPEDQPVTSDLTLFAGWVLKGKVVVDGEPISSAPAEAEKPAETAKPTEAAKPAGTPQATFTDVAAASPFAPAISWAVEKSITNGTTPTTFAPGNTCTRGHILTFLWRSQGSPEPTIQNPYKDEIPGAFQKAAVWAHEKGLVTGDTFGSATPCTRSSSVTYMWKLAGSPEAKAASFQDVAADSDYAKAVNWAVEQGVTNGTGDGATFSPDNTCTRGQIVTFLYRAYASK